jgi:hypothetical protein
MRRRATDNDDPYVISDTPHSTRRILVTDISGREAIRAEREHQAKIEADQLQGEHDYAG